MHSKTALSGMTLLLSTSLAGCYATWDIAPHKLARLDRFRAGEERTLQALDGSEVPFTSGSELLFLGRDGKEAQMQFRAIDFENNHFVGEREKDGAKLHVDLWRLASVKVRNINEGQTTLAVSGIVLGGGGTLVGMALLIALAGSGGGRPLRIADSERSVRAPIFFDEPIAPECHDDLTRTRLLAHWANEASVECASIPAFLALARDLQRASAPTNLVRAALRAAREEANHTRLCLELAGKNAETRARTLIPPIPRAQESSYEKLLERLVLEAFWDGCIAEGAAAGVARRTAPRTTDEKTRLALETIAHDEQGHADLAQNIIEFGLSVGGRLVRNALAESIERRVQAEEKRLERMDEESAAERFDPEAAARHGLPGRTFTREAEVEAWEKSLLLLA